MIKNILLAPQKAIWNISNPFLASVYKKLQKCEVGDFVYSDYSYSSTYAPDKSLLGIIGWQAPNPSHSVAGERLLIVSGDGYSQRASLSEALQTTHDYCPLEIKTDFFHFHLPNFEEIVRLFPDLEKRELCTQEEWLKIVPVSSPWFEKLKQITVLEKWEERFFWTSVRNRQFCMAVNIANGILYYYSKSVKNAFFKVLAL